VNEDTGRLADEARAGSRRAVARCLTLVEEGGARAKALLDVLAERAPNTSATLIGFTGPPGAGKSTLVNRVIEQYLSRGNKVGAIAVDPSSPFSGGAILGDRIRMDALVGAENAFFRSLGSRGAAGGLSNACAGAVRVLAACGYDPIVLETVGVGQSEVEIARLADIVVVVMAPGMGDEIQSIKAGILEIGDVYAVNKSDLPGADRTAHELRAVLDAPVLMVSALSGDGLDALAEALDARIAARPAERRFRKEIPIMTSTKIDHVGVAVNSIEESLAFYEKILGIEPQGTEEIAEQKVKVAFLPCGDSEIELLESTDPDGPVARFIEKNGEGIQHVAIRVESVESALAELKEKGVRLIDESPRYGAGGARIAFVHPKAAHGVLLELCERD
jgi:LAO/AO transport system kinase